MKKTPDYADDTDKEKTMRDFWLRLAALGTDAPYPLGGSWAGCKR